MLGSKHSTHLDASPLLDCGMLGYKEIKLCSHFLARGQVLKRVGFCWAHKFFYSQCESWWVKGSGHVQHLLHFSRCSQGKSQDAQQALQHEHRPRKRCNYRKGGWFDTIQS